MLGDVLDWDTGYQFISFVSYMMGLKSSKNKKGGVAPPGSADPPCKLEEEAEVQRVTTEPVPESINGGSPPPSSPRSPLSDASPQSVTKDSETPSTTEDTSFASCLTEEANSLNENPPISKVQALLTTNVVTGLSVAQKHPDHTANSDSEYESAEEVDLPLDPTFVITQQPSSEKSLSTLVVTNQTCSSEQAVTPCSDKPVNEEKLHLENTTQVENSITTVGLEPESVCIEVEKVGGEHSETNVENLASAISESLVTVTKNEIIEESISQKTFVEQAVTQVILNNQVSNEELNTNSIEINEAVLLERQESEKFISTSNTETVVKTELGGENRISSVTCDIGKNNHENQEHSENHFEVNGQITVSIDKKDIEVQQVNHCEDVKENHTEESFQNEKLEENHLGNTLHIESSENNIEQLCNENRKEHSESQFEISEQITACIDKRDIEVQQVNHCEDIKENHTEESIQNEKLQENYIENTLQIESSENHIEQLSQGKHLDQSIENKDSKTDQSKNVKQEESPLQSSEVDTDDIPIIPKKSYNLDFLDNLDDPNFNPFATKTAVRNTPPPSPEAGRKLPPLKPFIKKKKETKVDNKKSDLVEKREDKNLQDNNSISEKEVEESKQKTLVETKAVNIPLPDLTETTAVTESVPNDTSGTDQLIEVTFEDTSKPVKKVPPRLNRKSVPNKKPVSKISSKSKIIEKNNNRVDEKIISEAENKLEPEEELPIPPSKGYNLDFLDNIDDLNFNPFATKTSVSNSPPKEEFIVPNNKDIKPKQKVVSAKKPVKKGFTVIKNKVKTVPEKQDQKEIKLVEVDSTETKGVGSVVSVDKQSKETPSPPEVDEIPVPPQKGYNLDFLDDPNFNPFETRSSIESIQGSTTVPVEVNKPSNEVLDRSCADNEKVVIEEVAQNTSEKSEVDGVKPTEVVEVINKQNTEISTFKIEEKENTTSVLDKGDSKYNTNVCNIVNKEVCDPAEEKLTEKKPLEVLSENVLENKNVLDTKQNSVVEDNSQVVSQNKPLKTEKLEFVEENGLNENEDKQVTEGNKSVTEQNKILKSVERESGSFSEKDINLPKVPSIGTIGQLDSLEFAQLLGDEASRLAEEFMNCSTDSGLPDSDDSVCSKLTNVNSSMADKDCKTMSRLSAHLDENINPFLKHTKLHRSPPLGKRDMCGAEGGDASDSIDSFKPRRTLIRESVMGEERLDTSSFDDDSGIALGSRSDLETDVNHSEAGPEIATGLTPSDLQCASQLKTEDQDDELFDQITDEEFLASEAFFKEATDIENQLRKSLATPLRGSQSKLSGDEVTPTKDKPEPHSSTPEPQKPIPSTSTPVPPHEERSAPEGTSSPTPRPSDTSEHKPSSSRPLSIPSEGYMTAAEVQKLLKQQELQFEEKLLRSELAAGEKEKKLRQAMKDEQKEMNNLGESVSELTQSRDALLKLVGQYKGMLASLVSEKEKEKQNQEERIKTLEQERNQALEDLANVEVAFSDVHRKYERTKQVVDTLKRNEETLRGAVTDYENKLQKQEQKFIEFQKHAEEKIQLANEEFEAMRRANDQEMTKMAALLKKAEMKIMSLTDSNDRKTRENQELTQLCDDLINKVGTSH